MNRILLFSLFIVLMRLPVLAQLLSPDQLQADFARFRTALSEAHPEMYRYTSKPRFDSLFAATAAQLNRPMTQQAFYVTMVPLLVALRDGHIKWIVSGRDEHYPFATDKLFPLKLYFLGDKAWVVGNYGTESVPSGAEVISINGKPMVAIIEALLPNMTFADGDRIGGKLEDLNRYFSGYYATFIGAPDTFQVAYRVGMEQKTVTLAPVTESIINAYHEQHKSKAQKPFRLTLSENRTAVMTIERFWSEKNEQDFRQFLSESFREIKRQGVQHLVLDLRNNEGGEESWGVELYSYLASQPFRYYDHISVRQKKRFSFPAWSSKLYRMARFIVVKKRGDGYVFTHHRGLRTTKPKADAYAGKLYVLLNGNSFSVTTELAARIHADKRAVFIGQESGGGYKVNSSGLFAVTQLPNSKIDLGIGMFGFNMANVSAYPHTDRGIIPDHLVEPTVEDILTQQDRIMEYTLNYIRTQTATLTKEQ
ncbi:S41 family peptidase [Spirosoma sp. 48-14]|uniref:S41 family peptidase n=1 Tax=Spirosoma sp. 48-14 TaxID=1895854 RepID=UPI00095A2589|nr:S41 family peptidase [Spirosoma sp. 48-14]OJW76271.1 MAG: peptidase S41 [Spirosoma sp. 48-14]